MGIHELYFEKLLQLENLALEIVGKSHRLSIVLANEGGESERLVTPRKTSVFGSPNIPRNVAAPRRFFPRDVVLRFLVYLILGATLLFGVGGYYVLHFFFMKDQKKDISLMLITELVTLVFLLSFFFVAPLHLALGFSHGHIPSDADLARYKHLLFSHSGTQQTMTFVFCVVPFQAFGETLFFASSFPSIPVMCLFYFLSAINVAWIDLLIMYVSLVLRIIITRLLGVEEQVQTLDEVITHHVTTTTSLGVEEQLRDLDEIMVLYNSNLMNYGTATLPEDDTLIQDADEIVENVIKERSAVILTAYRNLRQDMHAISTEFGPRMLAGLFVNAVEVANIVGLVYVTLENELTVKQTFGIVLLWAPLAINLCLVFYNLSYPVTLCRQFIGARIATMATTLALSHISGPKLHYLARNFQEAPIRFHLGNFEMKPETSNVIIVIYAGLFFVILHLKMPEVA